MGDLSIITKSALLAICLAGMIACIGTPGAADAAPVTAGSGTDYDKGVFSLTGAQDGGTQSQSFGINISGGPSNTEINLFHIAVSSNLAGFTGYNEDARDPLRYKSLVSQFSTTASSLLNTSVSHTTRKVLLQPHGSPGFSQEEARTIDASAVKVAMSADYNAAQRTRAASDRDGGVPEDIAVKPERITAFDKLIEQVNRLGPNQKIAIVLAVALSIAGVIIWLT